MERTAMNHTTTPATPTSRREGTVMASTRNRKRLAAAVVAAVGLTGGAAAVYADTFSGSQGVTAAPVAWPVITPTCTDPSLACNVSLDVGEGLVTVNDVANGGPVDVPFLGFGVDGNPVSLAGSPNSTIKVPVGTTITITLNDGGNPVNLSFPSLPAGDVSNVGNVYTVHATKVGTMVFQPGNNAQAPKQIARGLVGVLVVTPDPTTCADPELKCAYDGTVYEDEALVAMTDLDLEYATDPNAFDMGYFGQSIDPAFSGRQVYHLINGKAFPDTDVIEVRASDDVLVRYVNAGVLDKAMGTLGLRQSLLGRNASKYTDPQTLVSNLVGPGETADVAVAIPADAPLGHYYSIMDQGRQLNNGTDSGFGGALTFLNVRDGTVAPLAVQALDVGGDTTTTAAGDTTTTAAADTTTTAAGDTTTTAAGDTTTTAAGDTTTTAADTTTSAAP
jgi:hypothetical protein